MNPGSGLYGPFTPALLLEGDHVRGEYFRRNTAPQLNGSFVLPKACERCPVLQGSFRGFLAQGLGPKLQEQGAATQEGITALDHTEQFGT